MVVIDQFSFLEHDKTENRKDLRMETTSKYIQHMCKVLKIPVLLLHQLNRSIEKGNRTPQLSDLRECGSLEEDADVVMFLHTLPKQDRTSKERLLTIAKSKLGAVQTYGLTLDTNRMIFKADEDEETELRMEIKNMESGGPDD